MADPAYVALAQRAVQWDGTNLDQVADVCGLEAGAPYWPTDGPTGLAVLAGDGSAAVDIPVGRWLTHDLFWNAGATDADFRARYGVVTPLPDA